MDGLSSFLFGALVTIVVAYYFHRKSIKIKKLNIYLENFSQIFNDIDTELKDVLKVSYKGKKIEHLYETTFSVTNTGNKAIRDIITPLTFEVADKFEVLEIKVISIEPEKRKVELIKQEDNIYAFIFPLLNVKEKFTFKILLTDKILIDISEDSIKESKTSVVKESFGVEDYFIEKSQFTISSDELPPVLRIKRNVSRDGEKIEYNLKKLSMSIRAISIGILIIYFTFDTDNYNIFHPAIFFDGLIVGKVQLSSEVFGVRLLILALWYNCIRWFFSGVYNAFLPAFLELEDIINRKN